MSNRFTGRNILLLEDEPLIALMFEQALAEAGAAVLTVRSVSEAQAAIALEPIDFASLNFNVGGQTCKPVATILRKKGVPFVITSGLPNDENNLGAVRWLVKPCLPDELLNALAEAIEK